MHPASTARPLRASPPASSGQADCHTRNLTPTVATFRSWRGSKPALCAGPEPSSPRKTNLARKLTASAGNSAPLERVVGSGHR